MALPQELHVNHWVAERSIAFLREQAAAETPFFLWCSFPDPHHPYCPPEPWAAQYDPAEVPLPTQREGELDELAPYFARIYRQGFQLSGRSQPTAVPERLMREIIARTYGMVSFVDHEVGRVLATLDELGLAEDTIVVYMSTTAT